MLQTFSELGRASIAKTILPPREEGQGAGFMVVFGMGP